MWLLIHSVTAPPQASHGRWCQMVNFLTSSAIEPQSCCQIWSPKSYSKMSQVRRRDGLDVIQTSSVLSTSHHEFLNQICFQRCIIGDLQDGRGVRRGDHLLPHKYIRNTPTCGTTPTEHLPNAHRGSQTSPKVRNSPCTWVGQKKKQRQKKRDGTCTTGREL